MTVGKNYAVYAITTFKCVTWFYVFDENELPYPVWEVADLFEVSDPTIPDSWVAGYCRPKKDEPGYPVISFPEWALDPSYYERLVEGDGEARRYFEARRPEAEVRSA